MDRRAYLIRNLKAYPTLGRLESSAFFAECRTEIESLLRNIEVFANPNTIRRCRPFFRVIQWNIEKGRCLAAILESFRTNEVLRQSDILLLNEVDLGMNRSGNLHIARSLAGELNMNMAFGPAHLELTKGTDDDLELPGDNRESLQGNAVLSCFPIIDARIVSLPVCFEPYEFHEKRFGRRNCVWARIDTGGGTLWVGAIHMEVRNTPGCRAAQMRHLLANLPGGADEPHLLGGDFNSNGFSRGTLWRTLKSVARLLALPPARLKRQLRRPDRGSEPLFNELRKAGFFWHGLNSADVTASAALGNIEDSKFIPRSFVGLIQKRLSPHEGYLHFKLDWLAGRGVRPLRRGDVLDRESGAASIDPGCVGFPRIGPDRISDHQPIYADFSI